MSSQESLTDVERTDDGIQVTLRGRYGTIDGWAPVREDLGLNGGGPNPVPGLELVSQEPVFRDEDDEYPRGHEEAVLLFEDPDALEAARNRLSEKATERFEYGMDKEAGRVRDFTSRLPTKFALEEMLDG